MTRDEYYNVIYLYASKDSDVKEDQKLAKIFKDDAPVNKVILDVGCGPGVTLKCITKGNKVFGVDIVDEYLEMARNNGYYQTVKHNLEAGLPFEASYFDIVVCTDLIEHLFETEFIGREIRRVLKDEGYAILNVPNHNELGHRLRFLSGKGINIHPVFYEDWNYTHIRFFTWNSWNEYLKKMGFEVIDFYPVPSRICIPIPQFIRKKFGKNSRGLPKQSEGSEERYRLLRKLYDSLSFRIPIKLARKFPNLFSYRFLVKVTKNKVA